MTIEHQYQNKNQAFMKFKLTFSADLNTPTYQIIYDCQQDLINMEQIDMLFDPLYEQDRNYREVIVRNQVAKAFNEIDVEASYEELFSSLWQTGMPCFDLYGMTAKTDTERSILKYCEWKGLQIPCSDIFVKFPTENGMCCSFNMKSAEDIFIKETFSRLVQTLQENDKKKSFHKNSGNNIFSNSGGPKSEPGKGKGLTVILDSHSDLFSASSVDLTTLGFTGFISPRGRFPQRILESFEIKPGHNNLVAVSGTIIQSDIELMAIDPAARNCYFEWENNFMKIYKNYTQSNCMFECNLFYAQGMFEDQYPASTKCFPWYFPSNETYPIICDPWQAVEMLKMMSDVPDRQCKHCLPDCSSTILKTRISTAPLRKCSLANLGNSSFCSWYNHMSIVPNMLDNQVLNNTEDRFGSSAYYQKKNFTSSQRKFGVILQNGDIFESTNMAYDAFDKDISKVQVFFRSATIVKYRRSPKMMWTDFFSSIGGNFGLVLGMGIVSVVELVWLIISIVGVVCFF